MDEFIKALVLNQFSDHVKTAMEQIEKYKYMGEELAINTVLSAHNNALKSKKESDLATDFFQAIFEIAVKQQLGQEITDKEKYFADLLAQARKEAGK